jgi:hypothetical protein
MAWQVDIPVQKWSYGPSNAIFDSMSTLTVRNKFRWIRNCMAECHCSGSGSALHIVQFYYTFLVALSIVLFLLQHTSFDIQ